MGKFIDLTGHKFGRLTVIKKNGKHIFPSGSAAITWECVCDCGNIITTSTANLRSGHAKSCGCYKIDKFVNFNKKHGDSHERLYHIWQGIKARCMNPNDTSYADYGGRGITVCSEWLGENGYDNFKTWSGKNGYKKNLSIDRIDVNGNYEPSNCRWATDMEQASNKRNSVLITYNEETKTASEWSRVYEINVSLILQRLKRGVSTERLFDKSKRIIEIGGEKHSVTEWAKIKGINRRKIYKMLEKGIPEEHLFDE